MTDTQELAEEAGSEGNLGYEIFMAGLSILSIVNLGLLIFVRDANLADVITVMNLVLTLIFLLDFIVRFIKAPSKKEYMGRGAGWADLISALPFQQTNILRLFRLIRVYRLIGTYGMRRVGQALIKERAETALLMLLLIGMLVLEFGSLEMLRLEQDVPGANITSASDALWYVIVTMATVGYGDEYPITDQGRIMGSFIIVVGVGIFGTLTGYLANLFLTPMRRRAAKQETVEGRFDELMQLNSQQQKALKELGEMIKRE
ncbi:MAG: ion transporter [Actinomycetota bacterium]